MTKHYVQPLPSVEELEKELQSGRLNAIEQIVRQAEIRALRNLEELLNQFPQNPEEARRVLDASEQRLREPRGIGYVTMNVWRCIDGSGQMRYPLIRVDVTDSSCLFGAGKHMNEESKEKLAMLMESGYKNQHPIKPFSASHTVLSYIDGLQIEVRALKTENVRMKKQGSRLYLLVANTDDLPMCAFCHASGFLGTLKEKIGIPIVGCFNHVEGAGDRPQEIEKEDFYAPLMVVDRKNRLASELSATPVDQFIEEWKKYWENKQ